MQIVILVQRHHAATFWEPRFYVHLSAVVGVLILSGMLYVGQPLFRGVCVRARFARVAWESGRGVGACVPARVDGSAWVVGTLVAQVGVW
jgi:hypothetical protein